MTSTAVDVGLCLLLVSAAAVTVATVPAPPPDRDRAGDVATTLATTTATVSYRLVPPRDAGADQPNASTVTPTPGAGYERTAHGTLATLLARAAVRTVRVDGEAPTRAATSFLAAVRSATLESLPSATQVVVRWQPVPGSTLERTFRVGPAPPPEVAVHAAVVTVPSGVRDVPAPQASSLLEPEATATGMNSRSTETAANATNGAAMATNGAATATGSAATVPVRTVAPDSFDALGNRLAAAVVAGLFPLPAMRHALAAGGPVAELVAHRYRRVADLLGVVLGPRLERRDVAGSNARLAEGLSEQFELDLRRRFESPERAARAADPGSVHVIVRTWSP